MSTTLLMYGCAVAKAHRAPRAGHPARAVFEQFVDLLYRRRQVRAAFESCVTPVHFEDHAAEGFAGRAAAMAALGAVFADADVQLRVLHMALDGDIGMVHVAVQASPGAQPQHRVDVYRIEDGRIAEHWEVAP